jgi:hypothetical protein
MKKSIIVSLTLILAFGFYSCADFLKQAGQVAKDQMKTPTGKTIDIAAGLKEALRVGTDSAVTRLNKPDGYFKDAIVKILLPDQIEKALNTFKSKSFTYLGVTISGDKLYNEGYPKLGINPLKTKQDELVLGINRAAEQAAVEAKPIFVSAITSMTIADANNILFGGVDTAATNYLRKNTFNQLFQKFEPKMDAALNAVKIGDKPVASVYENFVADYNKVLNTKVPSLNGEKTVASLMGIQTLAATDLSEYSTNKGLNGLFIKVKDKEADIRKNPKERVTQLLADVFGQLDK